MSKVTVKLERVPLTAKEQRVVRNRAELIRVAKEFKGEKIRLNMSSFAELRNEHGMVAGKTVQEALANPECKTTVCLAGRAGLDPFFRKRGVQLNICMDPDTAEQNGRLVISGDEDNTEDKLSEKFDLPNADGSYPVDDNGDNFVERVFYGDNEREYDEESGEHVIDKKATLDRIIGEIKRDTLERFHVAL